MTIDTNGVLTTVSREYEPEVHEARTMSGIPSFMLEAPAFSDVAQAVATAAAIAHRITPKETP